MNQKRSPMRKCIGCLESKPKEDLIRISRYEENISVDYLGKANGRGIYLCKDEECIMKAKKKNAIQRNFKTDIPKDVVDKIFEELSEYEKKS